MTSAVLLYNKSSGSHLGSSDPKGELTRLLENVGIEVHAMDGDLTEQLAASLETTADIVVVGGGDGTIRAAIETHRGKGRPIGIIPGGTMNLLAHDFGVPEEPAEAAKVIAAGHTIPVDYGCIDDNVFLHTCFTGLPVRIGRHREDLRGKGNLLDRLRLGIHAIRSLTRDPDLIIKAETRDGARDMVSPSYAILVGTIGDQMIPRPVRATVNGGDMTVFAIHPDSGADLARMVLKGAFGFLSGDSDVDKFIARSATIEGPRRNLQAMLDGEHVLLASPSTVSIISGDVEVFAPEKKAAEVAELTSAKAADDGGDEERSADTAAAAVGERMPAELVEATRPASGAAR